MNIPDPEPLERLSDAEVMAQVTLLAPGIPLMREVPSPTLTTTQQLFEHAEQLLDDEPMYAVIAGLRKTGLPSAEVRSQIRKELEKRQCRRIGMVSPENRLYQVAARFLVAQVRSADASIFKSPEEALAAFRRD